MRCWRILSTCCLLAVGALTAFTLALPSASAAPPVCGDGVCGGGEFCDGLDFCKTASCPSGTDAVCTADCGGFTCESTGSTCGNGVVESGEECDGFDLGGATCSDFGCSSGTLACNADCTLDSSGCSSCGTGSGTVELLFTERSDDVSETNVSAEEQRLLDLLDQETVAVRASIDGLSRSNVIDRLIAAHDRGVTVQVVADCEIVVVDASPGYQQLIQAGIPVVDDNNTFDGPNVNPGCTSNETSGFVHNKFLVFEGQQTVWTGSTNLTDFGFNSSQNAIVILAGNAAIVDFYQAEFFEMFGNGLSLRDGGTGQFGQQKDLNPGIGSFTLEDGTVVEIAFSPYNQRTTSDTEVLINATVDLASEELLWGTFFLTYDPVRQRIDDNSAASKRGAVDPRTTDSFDDTRLLIDNGEQVLVTNFLGSHHWKFVIADADATDGQVLLASHNFSSSSFNFNNENSVRILSPTAAQTVRNEFEVVWNDPQNTGLVGCIHPGESFNENSLTVHRCNDNFDNDFDGFVDADDFDCDGPFTCGDSCLPAGSLCSSNGECCSGSCHGPPDGRECK